MARLLRIAAILLPLLLVGWLFGGDLLDELTTSESADELAEDAYGGTDSLLGEGEDADGVASAPALAGRVDAAEVLARREREAAAAARTAATAPPEKGVPFEGRVLAPGGRPQEGVTIQARRQNGELITLKTDANGRFTSPLPPGVYSLLLTAPGIGARFIPRFRVDGSREEPLELELREVGQLVVTVQDLGEAVANAKVTATASGIDVPSDLSYEVFSGPDGTASFSDMPRTNYDILVEFPSGVTAERRVGVYGERALKIEVTGQVDVSGKVTEGEDGRPVQGALVRLTVTNGRGSGRVAFDVETETDYDGVYRLKAPRGGVRGLTIEAEGFAIWPNLAARVERVQMQRALAGIARGRAVTHNVALRRGALVQGVVTDEAGEPIPGLRLRAELRRVGEWFATTDASGIYTFPDLNPGTYEMYPATPGWFPESRLTVVVPGPPYDQPVGRDFMLYAARTVEGVVLGVDGKPAHGAMVWVTGGQGTTRIARRGGRVLEAYSDAAGRWSMGDIPFKPVAFRAVHGAAEALPVAILEREVPGGTVKLELIGTGSARVHVFDALSRGNARDIRVELRPMGAPGGRSMRRVTTNAGGIASFGRLIPGTYELSVQKTTNYLAYAKQLIDVPAGSDPLPVDVALDPGLVFEGRVLDDTGRPLRGARISLQWQTREGSTQRRNAPATGADGRFRMTGFESAAYTLRARHGRFKNKTLQGLRGGESNLRVDMEPRTPR